MYMHKQKPTQYSSHAKAQFTYMYRFVISLIVGNSASTPVPATRNCAVDYCIAASIGVTDIRVQ